MKEEPARYKPERFAALLGVHVKTLQRWDRENILKAYRSPTNRRYYTHQQYLAWIAREKEQEHARTIKEA